jgi:hypothetical protein
MAASVHSGRIFEMANHRIAHHGMQLVECVCHGENGVTNGMRGVTAFRWLLDKEDNFSQFLRHLNDSSLVAGQDRSARFHPTRSAL